jgi:hypothetical protein
MKVNRDQGATVEFCHPEGCSTARRIWLVPRVLKNQVLRVAQDDRAVSLAFTQHDPNAGIPRPAGDCEEEYLPFTECNIFLLFVIILSSSIIENYPW